MKLTKEECLNELKILCNYADMSASGEFVGKMLQDADDTLHKLIDEHFELKNKYEHIETERSMFKRELSVMVAALVKACKLLKKAGVVYGKENGKPVRLGKDAWFEKLVQDATKEMELEEE